VEAYDRLAFASNSRLKTNAMPASNFEFRSQKQIKDKELIRVTQLNELAASFRYLVLK